MGTQVHVHSCNRPEAKHLKRYLRDRKVPCEVSRLHGGYRVEVPLGEVVTKGEAAEVIQEGLAALRAATAAAAAAPPRVPASAERVRELVEHFGGNRRGGRRANLGH